MEDRQITAALKTVIADALEVQGEGRGFQVPYVGGRGDGTITVDGKIDLDRLAKAVRDHLRAKLATAILYACDGEGIICGVGPDEPLIIERTFDDEFLDRLIEGLAGGGSE